MGEQLKPDLVLPLTRHWFREIWNGRKTTEYREVKPYWTKRVGGWVNDHSPRFVMFQVGYAKNGPRILVQVAKTDIGPCPYEGWDGNFYRLHFEVVGFYMKYGDASFVPLFIWGGHEPLG